MERFETDYQPLGPYQGIDDDDTPLEDGRPIRYQYAPERSNARWNHIVDLDSFFTRVYQYHQKHGFKCMLMEQGLRILEFVFLISLSTFFLQCIDYPILFRDKVSNSTSKVKFFDAVIPIEQCVSNFSTYIKVCLFVAFVVFLYKMIKIVYNIFQSLEMKEFYSTALKIDEADLDNMTWHDVQQRLQEVQREQQMCIHKQELTELDIYHRILRYKNYMVALVNKDILPVKFHVPFLGEHVFLSNGLKYDFEVLLWKGYDAPFNQWSLRDEYKSADNRTLLAKKLAKRSMIIGILNLGFSFPIFIWQVVYSICNYGELVKREPGSFGVRRWSLYGRLYLRHFNELDHELHARLNRGYRPATKYMGLFNSHMLTIVARSLLFFIGSVGFLLFVLAMYDEDVLQVEHVLSVLTASGMAFAALRNFIPDENLIWCPDTYIHAILAQIHYMPTHWRGNSHTMKVRNEFGQLFQYTASYLLTEVFSPFINPFIMIFAVPYRTEKIVDFLRNFTVSVVGVGDVCSFAQMDLRKHGSPDWLSKGQQENVGFRTHNGKTELSLMHFTRTNPDWKPPNESVAYLMQLRDRAHRDAVNHDLRENPFYCSLSSLGDGLQYTSLARSIMHQSTTGSLAVAGPALRTQPTLMRGGLPNLDGPSYCANNALLPGLHQYAHSAVSGRGIGSTSQNNEDECLPHFNAADMSFSALYLHHLHHSQFNQDGGGDSSERALWQLPPSTTQGEMPNILENPAEEANAEGRPLVDLTIVCTT